MLNPPLGIPGGYGPSSFRVVQERQHRTVILAGTNLLYCLRTIVPGIALVFNTFPRSTWLPEPFTFNVQVVHREHHIF